MTGGPGPAGGGAPVCGSAEDPGPGVRALKGEQPRARHEAGLRRQPTVRQLKEEDLAQVPFPQEPAQVSAALEV